MNIDISKAWKTIEQMIEGVIAALPNLLLSLVVFILFYLAAKGVRTLVRRVNDRYRRHRSVGLVLGRLAQAGIILIGVLVALTIALPSFKPAQLIQFLGISTVAIGFAFQDIFKNFLAGILLLLGEPFRIGDQVVFKGFEGTVEEIQTRATFIRTYDGRRVVIPNSELFTQSVVVNTAFENRRSEYDVGIGYGDNIEQARRLILEAMRSVDDVLQDPAPDVLVVKLADSTVNLRARWWIAPPRKADELVVQDKVLTAVKNILTANGIDLPFPTQQILFHDQTEETDGDRARQREGWPAGEGNVPAPQTIAGSLRPLARVGAQVSASPPGRNGTDAP